MDEAANETAAWGTELHWDTMNKVTDGSQVY